MRILIAICWMMIAGLALAFVAPDASAEDVPQSVKVACRSDYIKFCSKHDPNSGAGRGCMAGVFGQLSDGCTTAILNSDLAEQPRTASTPVAKSPIAQGKTTKRIAKAAKSGRHASKKRRARRHAKRRTHSKGRALASARRSDRRRATKHKRANGDSEVAGYIAYGTSVAGYYVKKYTSNALADVLP